MNHIRSNRPVAAIVAAAALPLALEFRYHEVMPCEPSIPAFRPGDRARGR